MSFGFPGPGLYQPKPVYRNDGSTKIGSASRQPLYNEKMAGTVPAANKYSPKNDTVQRNSVKYSFGY